MINRVYQKCFGECFVKQYSTIEKLNTHEQGNVTQFFAHLVGTPALPLQAIGDIRLPLEDAISSLRIYMKMLFQVSLRLRGYPSSCRLCSFFRCAHTRLRWVIDVFAGAAGTILEAE